ncbi:MAG: hypothetical protein CMG71_05730 [Candidatus Marinimicrobia bacterium]|nr:hypothetical protein [Candidatus Neomarinimicrobiota bacterium]|tara:strand:+ start:4086 stop:5852 length:1767 start_codon:yes stop_codon:yes gene_type:complete
MRLAVSTLLLANLIWSGELASREVDVEALVSALRQMAGHGKHQAGNLDRGDFTKCGVPVLKKLGQASADLDEKTVEKLAELGIRHNNQGMLGFSRPQGLEWHYDTGIFRIHYTLRGRHAVDSTDSNMDGIPDFVELMAETAERVFEVEIGSFGFTRPPSDQWYADNGGSDAYDIYLLDIGENLFGYTQMEHLANYMSGNNEFSDTKEENALTSYIAMNNDYGQFLCEESACVEVTLAHEFFHAIQFGYDAWDKIWFLEASAVWMEDEVFDDINDNYYYLDLWMRQPHVALDQNRSPHWYGSWIYFRYLSEHFGGPLTIRKIFERSVVDVSKRYTNNSIHSIDVVLRNRGSSFRETLNAMVVANHLLTSNTDAGDYRYEEGDAYRQYGIEPQLSRSVALSGSGAIVQYSGSQLMHNAAHYIGFTVPESAVRLNFESLVDSIRFNVNGIPEMGNSFSVYRARGNTIIPITIGTDRFTVAIVTDTVKHADYHYKLDMDTDVVIPTTIALSSNFPNPFNNTTTIRFFLPTWEEVSLSVVDLGGREVKQLALEQVQAGYNEVVLEARDLPSGPYLIKLDGETETVAQKMMLIK